MGFMMKLPTPLPDWIYSVTKRAIGTLNGFIVIGKFD
jgi:hypothetical protein